MYNIYDIEKINYYLIYNDEKQVLQLILLPWAGTSVMALMCEKVRVPGKKPRLGRVAKMYGVVASFLEHWTKNIKNGRFYPHFCVEPCAVHDSFLNHNL